MSKLDWLSRYPIAHRGFHDMNKAVWENTLSAFKRAIDAGFAIECDLQFVSNCVPVVFHDHDLERLCGVKGDVRAKTSGELGLLTVGQTADRIPTLKQLLDLTQGRVPLVIELKGREGDDEGFVESVLEVLEGYQGAVALMSFDHHLLKDLRDSDCPFPMGLTAMGDKPEELAVHAQAMAYNPDFISYFVGHLPNSFVSEQQKKGVHIITWTVRDEIARAQTYKYAEQMTFEGFDPRESQPATA